jgi:antigen flippase
MIDKNTENSNSYKQIFKSTGIVGGSKVSTILIGILRIKVLALILGPAGVGIAGIFQTIMELVRDSTGFGINFSGVKDIAEISASSDDKKVAKTIKVLRRWALGTGLLGMLITILFSGLFSSYSFGNSEYTLSIGLLSLVILINSVSAGQIALLQGLRRIKQMAKASLIGTALGTSLSIPLYYWLGVGGIVPGMIVTALGALATSWLYAKKIQVVKLELSLKETFNSGLGMAKLGFFMVINGFVAALSMYLLRALIASNLDLASVGYFQAVWTISTMYINILLVSMLADYFPRLTILKGDRISSNKLINEQLEITTLVGGPMIMGMIIFSFLIINILYSSEFFPAIPILKWQMMASFFTLISWPLGVVYLSNNRGWFAVFSETLRQSIYLGVVYFGWEYWGFESLGISFLIANFVTLIFVYFSVKEINDFRFSVSNLKHFYILGVLALFVLIISLVLNSVLSYVMSGIALIFAFAYCYIKLDELIDFRGLISSGFSDSKKSE